MILGDEIWFDINWSYHFVYFHLFIFWGDGDKMGSEK